MRFHHDRPFKNIDKFVVTAEFVVAAERLMVHDVTPELLPESDRSTVQYYLKCLSQKFCTDNGRVETSSDRSF